jgi:hypothetical protein
MNNLRMVTAADPSAEQDADSYWRGKYLALQDESIPATIRSLRAQLLSIKQVVEEETDAEEMQRRILIHVRLGLTVSK